MAQGVLAHTQAFKYRRFWNWFPMGLSYALLYMGRYNLTVAKTSLGDLMTKEDFGIIFGAGTFVYALAFIVNGPMVDRLGGRFGMLLALIGSSIANFLMGGYLLHVLDSPTESAFSLRLVFSVLYAINMYFQAFGAVSIVKVNAHWFHVNERGGFSGIFGTMISSGIFLAFTVNGWLLDVAASVYPGQKVQWVVFFGPSILLGIFFIIELFLLRDKPSQTGFKNFDTGDASSGDKDDKPVPTFVLLKRILTNPIILTVAFIEFCTGVLRNGVMHWFPIYAKEVWALSGGHGLRYGGWEYPIFTVALFVVGGISFFLAGRKKGTSKGMLYIFGSLAFLAPFMQGGWGGILFIAGVIGGNVAGWVSDLFFQSRRAPTAGGLYAILTICCLGMAFSLAPSTNKVEWAKPGSTLQAGDEILEIAGVSEIKGWVSVMRAVRCFEPECIDSVWDKKNCICTTKGAKDILAKKSLSGGDIKSDLVRADTYGWIPAQIKRGGNVYTIQIEDTDAKQRAGDVRSLSARPVLPFTPWILGALVFVMSLCVIGTHGLLSGTATMDFGGSKGAATAVGIIDGFVYAGTALQSIVLGYLTTQDWTYWPWFLLPFGVIGFVLLTRIWHAKPRAGGAH